MSKLLPKEYQRLEYIESSGTQYLRIITGNVDNTYGLKMEYSMNTISDNYPAGFSTTNNKRFLFWGTYQSAWRYGWYSSSTAITTPNYSFSQYPTGIANFYTASLNYLNSGKCQFADNPESNITGYGTAFTNTDFLLFKSYSTTGVTARIKWAKLTKGTEIIRDLIPCRRSSDNVLGMYDLVNDVFYTNVGSGTFVAGPALSLPESYQELKYIANNTFSSSNYQYIDTGWYPDFSKHFIVEFTYIPTATGKRYCLGSSYSGTDNVSLELSTDNKQRIYLDSAAVDKTSTNTFVVNEENKGIFEWIPTTHTWRNILNGQVYTGTSTAVSGKSAQTMLLFVDQAKRYSTFNTSLKIGKVKIYEDGQLIHSLVSCKNTSTNAIGMYDLITSTDKLNAGTGSFTAGPSVAKHIATINGKVISNINNNLIKSINGTIIMPGKIEEA